MSKVEFLEDAIYDLEDIVAYIANDSILAASEMKKTIITRARELEKFPRRGMPVPDAKMKRMGWRMFFIKPYVAFYRVIESKVIIYRILHGASDYPKLYESMSKELL